MLKAIHNFFSKHYHRHYHNVYYHAKKLFIFDLFLLALSLIILAAGIFFFFWNPNLTDLINLKLSIGTQRILSGDTIHLTIDYENNSKFLLKNPLLSLRLPVGFEIDKEQTPENIFSNDSFFNIAEIKPGAKGMVEIYGKLWGTPKTEEKITAILSYIPENNKNREQKFGSLLLNLPNSVLQSELSVVTNTFSGSQNNFDYKIKNLSDKPVKHLSANFRWNNGVELDPGQNTADFTLAPNEEKQITGKFNSPSKSGDYRFFSFVNILVNNQTTVLNQNMTPIKTFSPNINIEANLNNAPSYVEPGSSFTTEIKWKKDEKFIIKNKKLIIAFSPAIVDLKKTAYENNLRTDGRALYATAKERTALGDNALNEDSFLINIHLLPTFKNFSLESSFLNITPKLEAKADIAGIDTPYTATGQTEKIKLATEVFLDTQARYFTSEGDQLGRGPIPPVIGKTTKYWMSSIISNTSNAIRSVKFSAILPKEIVFTGKQSVSIGRSINYDQNSRQISWNYYELPPHSQTGLYFEVAVTPTNEQLGKNIILLKNISLFANDKETGKTFNLKNNDINNILNSDDKGAIKGAEVSG